MAQPAYSTYHSACACTTPPQTNPAPGHAQANPPPPYPYPTLSTHLTPNGQPYTYLSPPHRPAQPCPAIDPTFPACNLINSTGGVGAEPGYNYFFPSEHAKVIVLKHPRAPWIHAPGPNAQVPFHACHVPSSVTMAEVLVGFGAQNRDKSRNRLHVVYPQGGGRWGHMEEVRADDKVMTGKTVREMGWCVEGEGGKKGEVVYLWVQK